MSNDRPNSLPTPCTILDKLNAGTSGRKSPRGRKPRGWRSAFPVITPADPTVRADARGRSFPATDRMAHSRLSADGKVMIP
jgi:hypothetical protein